MAIKITCQHCRKKYDYGKQCECVEKRKAEYNKIYDECRKSDDNITYYKFYRSKEWLNIRTYILSKYNGMCLHCWLKENRIVTDGLVIHHIIALKDNWELRLMEDNLIPLCSSCHSDKNIHDDAELCRWLRDNY